MVELLLAAAAPDAAHRHHVRRGVVGPVEQLLEAGVQVGGLGGRAAHREVAADGQRIGGCGLAPRAVGFFEVDAQRGADEALALGGHEADHLAALAGPELRGLHAVAERRVHRRVRLLQRPGHDADLAQRLVLVDRCGVEVVGGREVPFHGGRHLPELALDRHLLLGPQRLHQVPVLVQGPAVALVGLGLVGLGGGDAEVLAERSRPARRVAAREPGERPPAGEVVEHGDVLGKLDGVDGGEVHAELSHPHSLCVLGHEVVPEERVGGGLDALGLHVLLGHGEAVVAHRLGELHLRANVVHEGLPALGHRPGQPDLLATTAHVRHHEDGEAEVGHRRLAGRGRGAQRDGRGSDLSSRRLSAPVGCGVRMFRAACAASVP